MFLSYLFYFTLITLLTFLTYAYDKWAARGGHWRISEKTLHILSLVGGWVGALLAQQLLRHKTVKQPFQPVFWCTIFLNLVFMSLFSLNFERI
jgi:uncharacterized membrane protein YsdA (DUF1294 family)